MVTAGFSAEFLAQHRQASPSSMRFIPRVLLTNGIDLDARQVAFDDVNFAFFDEVLNVVWSPDVQRLHDFVCGVFDFLLNLNGSVCGGMLMVASPLWTPAFSTCSIMEPMRQVFAVVDAVHFDFAGFARRTWR